MLVLSRRKNDVIEIGKEGDVLTGPIVLKFVDIRRLSARIGIEAQRDIAVLRPEAVRAPETEGGNHQSHS
jgi:sRNA-binding carbon storage regulator CsrA